MNNALHTISALADKFSAKSKEIQYVYHIKPDEFDGNFLYSLSELSSVKPAAYKNAIKKYEGRKDWIEREIPSLACQAKDVVNLSTINPIKLFIVEILLDIEKIEDKCIFKIPISSLKNQDCVLFSYNKDLKYKYKKQNIKNYKECITVPSDTVDHYLDSKKNKESPLIFEYVPHLLVKGKVDISDAEIIKFKASDVNKLLE